MCYNIITINIKNKFNSAISGAKLIEKYKDTNIYNLWRHFYATQSIYNGVSQQIIADNMGISMSRLNKSYKHCFLRVQTNHLFKKSDTQNPINNMRSFGTGEYAFFMGVKKQKSPIF